MKTIGIILCTLGFAFRASACGTESENDDDVGAAYVTAEEFCLDKGGVDEATYENDGDVDCRNGTEFEAEQGDEAEE